MKLLGEYTHKREGNECLITDYICLVKLEYDLYLVTHTEKVYGGWTGNPITTESATFEDYSSAADYMNTFIDAFNEFDNDKEDEEEYVPSAENGDYSPSNPWDAPGMSIHDFI